MSQPMINPVAHERLARVVYDLPDDLRRTPLLADDGKVFLPDVELLCETLAAEVPEVDLTAVTRRLEELGDAIREGARTDLARVLSDDLWTLDAADLKHRVREAARDLAVQKAAAYTVSEDFERALLIAASTALTADIDAVVTALAKSFDAQAQAVTVAAKAGITKDSDVMELLDTGSEAVIAAYRALNPAVVELNRLARLRANIAQVLRYGPKKPIVAMFVTDIQDRAQLEGASNLWTGETEVVQHILPSHGSHLAEINAPRLGGCWLDLVNGGYHLHLNNAVQAQAVLDGSVG